MSAMCVVIWYVQVHVCHVCCELVCNSACLPYVCCDLVCTGACLPYVCCELVCKGACCCCCAGSDSAVRQLKLTPLQELGVETAIRSVLLVLLCSVV